MLSGQAPLYQHSAERSNRLATRVTELARNARFELVGILGDPRPAGADHYHSWIDRGYHGEMAYLARPDAIARRHDPSLILPGVRSIVVVGTNYHTRPLPPALAADLSRGLVASYAWGADYHDLMLPRLERLAGEIEAEMGTPIPFRAYVDTGPILERAMAEAAGLGFTGKNTCLIHPRLGSWLLLGELFLGIELPPTPLRLAPLTCGRCSRCLDACPTGAFVAPYILDARRCISYLTIELRGPIPRELRPAIGNRIFGCDVCQEVCPWNWRFARPTAEPAFSPAADVAAPSLVELLDLDERGFRSRYRHSAVWRTKRSGLLRNVAVALGNWASPRAVPPLARALEDPEPLVRGHAAWSLGRIANPPALRALQAALELEGDPWVRDEIQTALSGG